MISILRKTRVYMGIMLAIVRTNSVADGALEQIVFHFVVVE